MNRDLGQFFTPPNVVKKMLGLRENNGSILEPSCGDGAFLKQLEEHAVGVEVDRTVIRDSRVIFGDFLSYPLRNKFDTIIGNPPYVRYEDILHPTKALLDYRFLDKRSNLYLFFISKCIDHLNDNGEIIFITPRDFLKLTSARYLNEILYQKGSMTHYYELGDKKIFKGATPNCAIWRWEKGRTDRSMVTSGTFQCRSGQIMFNESNASDIFYTTLGDYFDIKVGACSGADDIFIDKEHGCTDMVYSGTAGTGKTRKVIYNRKDDSLLKHKKKLIERGGKEFNESNWWEWCRVFHKRSGKRIYVNTKTRNMKPFFVSDVEAYDGSVLALFPRGSIDIDEACEKLNNTDWDKLGFLCGGRLLFAQKSLVNIPITL